MKTLMEKLASGNAVYEMPDVEISENRISVELESGDIAEGEINICGKNGMRVKGIAFSSDCHIVFDNNQFDGVHNTVKYRATTRNLLDGQICSGTISIVTTAGDYAIPFAITVKKRKISSTIGAISDLQEFVKLVRHSYDEALILFLSKEFQTYFLKEDSYAYSLYRQVMQNTNRKIALEEFLVGMKLKERVSIDIVDKIHEYTDITENYGGILNITRSTWGYVDIDVSVQGDFLHHCKEKISGDEFNGKIAEYQYLINANKLHGGSNCGRILLKTSGETVCFDIVIVNQKNKIDQYLTEKRSDIHLVKNYLEFRIGKIDAAAWKETMSEIAKSRLEDNQNDAVGILIKAQIAILNNNSEQANEFLSQASAIVAVKDSKNIIHYCYYLYLKSLYKNNAEYTNAVKNEIKDYFEGGFDRWQLLWMLFYMDDRYDDNPSLKYTMIKRMFHNGCYSPIMYYEAASVLNSQPELLRVFNRFEIQVLNFAGKYHMISDDLAKQAAEIMSRERMAGDTHIRIMSRIYEETENTEVLSCLCAMIIHGNRREHQYFRWLEEGVKKELKITNLYEYYIYTADTSGYECLEKAAYRYFSYGTDTLAERRDYFYANLITNFDATDDLVIKCRGKMEEYATQQLRKGNNNIHLRVIYSALLNDTFIVGDLQNKMPEILHTYLIQVRNQNIKSVMVSHKEVTYVQSESLVDKKAYIQLYTKNPVITFMDYQGRILSEVEYELKPMLIDNKLTKTGSNLMTRLCELEQVMEDAVNHQGKVELLKQILDSPEITKHFREQLKEFMVDYYYRGYDQGELDLYLLQLNMAELSGESRNKVMEVLIQRNLTPMVYPYIVKYGYINLGISHQEKLCRELAESEEYAGNEIVVEMCGNIFRNGCREEAILKYLGKYYESGTLELYQLFLALQSKEIEDNTLAERLLVQYIFEGSTEEKLYDIYQAYLKGATKTVIRKAFYTYATYNYFIKKVQCPEIVWEILEQEYENGLNTSLIAKIAFVEVMSERETLTERQIKICQNLITDLVKSHVNFEFYKKFYRWFKIPFYLVDKSIIDFRTNPKHRVDITYSIKTAEGDTAQVTEEMGSVYPGIFSKEIIMFYGEEINYYLTEYSEEAPHGKVVDNYSVKITEKNAYNDESRFGLINGIMICKDLGRDDAAREMMQSYQLCKDAGKEMFKLL